MAVKDVKEYYYKIQAQYLEMKQDLADFTQALQDGYITEDQLISVKENVALLEANYDRLTYVMYLLEQRKNKAPSKSKKALLKFLETQKADETSVVAENDEALKNIKADLDKLKTTEEE